MEMQHEVDDESVLEPEHELTMKFDGAQVCWCETQDVISIISKPEKESQCHQLDVYRIGWEVEKIASDLLPEEPSACSFSHNGQHIAVGFKNGQISLLKTESLDEVFCAQEGSKGAINALNWKKMAQSVKEESDPLLAQFKPLMQIDPKPSEHVKELFKICQQAQQEQGMLVASDSTGVITFFFSGVFPLAKIDLAQVLMTKEGAICCDKIDVNEDCSEVLVMGKEQRGQFVVRLDTSLLSTLVMRNSFARLFMRTLPQLEHFIGLVEKQNSVCKREWTKFHGKYLANMRVLIEKIQERQARHRSSATSQYQRENPLCSELITFVAHSQLSDELFNYIVSELTNTNILASLAENCQVQLQLVQDEVTTTMLPALSHLAYILSTLRAQLKGKQSVVGDQSHSLLGFQLDQVQSLVDINNGLITQLESLQNDLVRAKRELRNFFVFMNQQVLKIHTRKQDLKEEHYNSQEQQPPEREEISNSRSDIAKLNANLQVLLQTLQHPNGDKYLMMHHISRYFDTNDPLQQVDKASEDPLQTLMSLATNSGFKLDQSIENQPQFNHVSMALRAFTQAFLKHLKSLIQNPQACLSSLISIKQAPICTWECREAEILDIATITTKVKQGHKFIREVSKSSATIALRYKSALAILLLRDDYAQVWFGRVDQRQLGSASFEISNKDQYQNMPSWRIICELQSNGQSSIEHFNLNKAFDNIPYFVAKHLWKAIAAQHSAQGESSIKAQCTVVIRAGLKSISTGHRSIYSVLCDRRLLKLYWPDQEIYLDI